MAGHQVIWKLLASADLIVTAGFDPVELITPWRLPVPVLHVDTVPNTDQVYPASVEVVGNVATRSLGSLPTGPTARAGRRRRSRRTVPRCAPPTTLGTRPVG